jgi:hypothetical protein
MPDERQNYQMSGNYRKRGQSHEQKTLETHFLPESLGRLMALATVDNSKKEREQKLKRREEAKLDSAICKN